MSDVDILLVLGLLVVVWIAVKKKWGYDIFLILIDTFLGR